MREQVRQHLHPIIVPQSTRYLDPQALANELIDYREHPEHLAVMGACLDEVIGPDMVRPARSETDARAIIEPKPAPLRLLVWNLQRLTPPDALYALVVHVPAFSMKQCRDPSIAVAAILTSQADDRRGQRLLVISIDGLITLRRAGLAKHTAGTPLRHGILLTHMLDTLTAARGA